MVGAGRHCPGDRPSLCLRVRRACPGAGAVCLADVRSACRPPPAGRALGFCFLRASGGMAQLRGGHLGRRGNVGSAYGGPRRLRAPEVLLTAPHAAPSQPRVPLVLSPQRGERAPQGLAEKVPDRGVASVTVSQTRGLVSLLTLTAHGERSTKTPLFLGSTLPV